MNPAVRLGVLTSLAFACALSLPVRAADPVATDAPTKVTAGKGTAPTPARKASAAVPTEPPPNAKEIGDQVRAALEAGNLSSKTLPLTVDSKNKKITPAPVEARKPPRAPATDASQQGINQQYLRARGIPLPGAGTSAAKSRKSSTEHEIHWSYTGEGGPQAWGQLKPEFAICANGKRQSPINIESGNTLVGPAAPIQFNYQPSQATVVNNGHTIQVDLSNDSVNTITVRDSTYRLVQFHFHTPSEERINGKPAAMVAHLVHRNADGQLAVVAVLLEPGQTNPVIDKVWTYLPLDEGDKVRMPAGLLDMNEMLPKDQRYYQFMGSLTTPPCTEGVLWLIFKQPGTLSPGQLKLFTQLFPLNARPVQPLHGRPVREGQ